MNDPLLYRLLIAPDSLRIGLGLLFLNPLLFRIPFFQSGSFSKRIGFEMTPTCLRHRSMVESVYVSPNRAAQSAIASRDMTNTDEELKDMELDNCAGSTQSKY